MDSNKVCEQEIISNVDTALTGAETLRKEGLEMLSTIQAVKLKAEKKRHKQLGKKLGSDNPRVKVLSDKIDYRQGVLKDLTVEIDRANMEMPSFSSSEWLLHGRVVNEEKNGVSSLMVGLTDKAGRWMSGLGFGCTDKRGYFALKVKEDEIPEDIIDSSGLLYIVVTDKKQIPVARDKNPVEITLGSADYRVILMTKDGTCIPPGDPDIDPPPVKDTWRLRGRVIYRNKQPLLNAIVSIGVTANGEFAEIGRTTTDERGHYYFSYRIGELREKFLSVMGEAPEGGIRTTIKVTKADGAEVKKATKTVELKGGKTYTANLVASDREKRSGK